MEVDETGARDLMIMDLRFFFALTIYSSMETSSGELSEKGPNFDSQCENRCLVRAGSTDQRWIGW